MKTAIEHYQYLHTHPELSGTEIHTTDYIFQELSVMGYAPVRTGGTGVYADRISDPDADFILFRADMDALPITEETGLSFASQNPGIMHACGHDAHTSMLLEAASRLIHFMPKQNIRFLFQPAEETVTGAKKMIEYGALPKSLIACFAMHVWPGVPYGIPVTRAGALMASSDVYRLQIDGKSAHCAKAYEGEDALQTAVQTAAGFPELLRQASDPRSLLFCGKLHSGSGYNVVAADALMEGTIRTYSEEDRTLLKKGLEALAFSASESHHTRVRLSWEAECPPLLNHAALVEKLQCVLDNLLSETTPSLAAEDFARYTAYAPGVMIWLGLGEWAPLHSSRFYVPEEILDRGIDVWMRLANTNWRGDSHD